MADFHGHLFLRAEARADGRTAIGGQAFRAPFHVSKPYWDEDTRMLLVQVVNPTAGILSGDRLESAVEVAAGAAVLLTTPSASRVFKMREGEAGGVKEDGGGDEAKAVGESAGVGGDFGAVGETVEGGEESGETETGGERQAFGEGDHEAEGEEGGGDHLLHAGGNDAVLAEDGGESHDADEGGGDEPTGASAELGGPDADGDHGEKMVETEDGVGEAAGKIPGEVVAAVVAGVG